MADRQRTALALREPVAWNQFAELAKTAEETGYEALFVPESVARDGFATLAALAPVTSSLLLGTGVVPITARRPQTTAMAAATVQELSGGRFILGLGAGFERSLEAVRTYVREVRAELGFDFGRPPPLWLAALGDRMIELAAHVADGVLLNWCTPERVARARATLRSAATAAGRDPASLTVAVYVRACLEPELDVALSALRRQAQQYASIPHYRRQLEAMGLGAHVDVAASGSAPEEFVRALCLVGDPGTASARLQAYRDAGADIPVVYPVPALEPVSSLMGTILAVAPTPALEA